MPIPEKIGRYVIKSELGRGGMATVYRAHDPLFEREVALKILPREMLHDPQFRSRFEREIKMVASLEHPSIVPVYDVGEEDGQPYFVMRFMTGGSLSDLIAKGQFSIQDTATIIGKVAQGLAFAHRKGIIHRDLKPDNILFDENGDPFISDFGIAKVTEGGSNLTGSGVIGTPAYMSPEQAQGVEIDSTSDVYGLGVIVYQMISGHQPYSADTPMGVVVKHITEPVPEILKMVPELPVEMDDLIKTAMAKDKTKRYETTIDLAKALNKIAFGNEGNFTVSNTGIQGRIASNGDSSSTPRNKTGLIVVGVVLLVAVIGFFLIRNQLLKTETPATNEPVLTTVAVTDTSSASEFAPACSANIKLPEPEVKETNSRCTAKKPYVFFTTPLDATVESLSPDATCKVEGVSDGKQIISCVGTNFLISQAKFCLPLPPPPPSDLNQCSPDSTFNAENSCCMAVPPQDAGCIIQEMKFKGCE